MRFAGITAIVAIALAAAVPVASAAGKKPCAIVTAADVSKALHAKVGSGKRRTAGAFATCTYVRGKTSIVVKTRPLGKKTFDRDVHAIAGSVLNATNVSPNAWVTFTARGISLMIWQHGAEVVVDVLGQGDNAS